MGGDLASIPDEETYVMLRDRAYKLLVAEWWIGLNDRDEEGTFVWSDGTTGGYRPWADGEPNDSGGEDCGHFWTAHGGMYNDMPCDRVQPYICQLETP